MDLKPFRRYVKASGRIPKLRVVGSSPIVRSRKKPAQAVFVAQIGAESERCPDGWGWPVAAPRPPAAHVDLGTRRLRPSAAA